MFCENHAKSFFFDRNLDCCFKIFFARAFEKCWCLQNLLSICKRQKTNPWSLWILMWVWNFQYFLAICLQAVSSRLAVKTSRCNASRSVAATGRDIKGLCYSLLVNFFWLLGISYLSINPQSRKNQTVNLFTKTNQLFESFSQNQL